MIRTAFVAALCCAASSCAMSPAFADSGRRFSGLASFYGEESGTKTASGQRLDQYAMTAAHRSLPFGTRCTVSRGGRSVVVTINDRGPAAWTGKVLDLSVGAARAVGITLRMGVGRVAAVCGDRVSVQ